MMVKLRVKGTKVGVMATTGKAEKIICLASA
jgi:hypothetical protein